MIDRPRHPAFTMIELVLAIVVLAISALVVVPRLVSRDRRQEEQAAQGVREALSAAARREALTSRGVAIEFDGQSGTLSVLSPEARAEGDWSRQVVWTPDLFVTPASLGPVELVLAVVDSVPQPANRWRAVLSGLDIRPEVRLTLRGASTGQTWVITLAPDSTAAAMTADGAGASVAVDLDRTGLRDAAW
jgi:type II secretory pathway pseudopilin PulG